MQQRDEKLEAYFDTMKDLCNYKAFQQLQEEMRVQATNVSDLQNVKDEKDLFFRKGQLNVIGTLLNLRENVDTLEENYLAELKDE